MDEKKSTNQTENDEQAEKDTCQHFSAEYLTSFVRSHYMYMQSKCCIYSGRFSLQTNHQSCHVHLAHIESLSNSLRQTWVTCCVTIFVFYECTFRFSRSYAFLAQSLGTMRQQGPIQCRWCFCLCDKCFANCFIECQITVRYMRCTLVKTKLANLSFITLRTKLHTSSQDSNEGRPNSGGWKLNTRFATGTVPKTTLRPLAGSIQLPGCLLFLR